ncbi:MAG: hypothetical protein AAFR52_15580, partial [Pseudomonadota bacterium]
MIFSTVRASKVALVSSVSALALSGQLAHGQTAASLTEIADLQSGGQYLSGDKHNHTTCTDGAMSVQTVVNESLVTYDLDWFAQTGHGGEGTRDCRFDDPEYDADDGLGNNTFSGKSWQETIAPEDFGGDEDFSGDQRQMMRWQNLIEFAYPLQRQMGEINDEPAWLGLEHNAPGHEHVSMSILERQLRARGTGYNMGQFEYLFDRSDEDTSGGDAFRFEAASNNGTTRVDDDGEAGEVGHENSRRAVTWLRENFGDSAYYVPAHVERQGGFVSDSTRGWNIEHFRNLHSDGLLSDDIEGESIVFGAEMLAGHQFANGGRGTYEMDRPTAGFGTYGGAGSYSGAEVSEAGFDFDGNPITNATLTELREEFNALFEDQFTEPSGSDAFDQLDACEDCPDPAPEGIGTSVQERFVLGRPGINTMWDAMLQEGRRFFNFGSSDWHNRGQFGPWEPQSTLDPWPGEYNKIYSYISGSNTGFSQGVAEAIVDGMRTGNTYSVMGDVIEDFYWTICQGDNCATLGETLTVDPAGPELEYSIVLTDPAGTNFSPYSFDNMSLAQSGVSIPTNEPVLSHVDVLAGVISGEVLPEDEAYTSPTPASDVIRAGRIWNPDGPNGAQDVNFTVDGETLTVSLSFPLTIQQIAEAGGKVYARARGTNMPPATANETDENG